MSRFHWHKSQALPSARGHSHSSSLGRRGLGGIRAFSEDEIGYSDNTPPFPAPPTEGHVYTSAATGPQLPRCSWATGAPQRRCFLRPLKASPMDVDNPSLCGSRESMGELFPPPSPVYTGLGRPQDPAQGISFFTALSNTRPRWSSFYVSSWPESASQRGLRAGLGGTTRERPQPRAPGPRPTLCAPAQARPGPAPAAPRPLPPELPPHLALPSGPRKRLS